MAQEGSKGKYVIRYDVSGKGKGLIIVTPTADEAPVVTLSDGTKVKAIKASDKGGYSFDISEGGPPSYQWILPQVTPDQLSGLTVTHGGKTSSPLDVSTTQEYRVENGNLTGLKAAPSKSGGGTPGGSGAFGNYTPGQAGNYGVIPANIEALFPDPVTIANERIEAAPYTVFDTESFIKDYGGIVREETAKNFETAKGFALDALDTELQGLKNFVPEVAALKRSEVAADNTFNQAQRTAQLQTVMPEVVARLKQQGADASAYAAGRAPDAVIDAALEANTRSGAADLALSAGFGAGSSANRNMSDMMSASMRLGLSQYGNQLINANTSQQQSLLLAPTSYSNAGEQTNVTPSISGSQLQTALSSELGSRGIMDAGSVLSAQIQQSQFYTNLLQSTNVFNASNQINVDQFNAGVLNQFAMTKFNYQAGYAGAVAAGAQNNINTQVGIEQQQEALRQQQEVAARVRRQQRIKDVSTAAFGIGTAIALSDKRAKHETETYSRGLEDIQKLETVTFKYLENIDPTQSLQFGLIAQELQEVMPEAVATSVTSTGQEFLTINPWAVTYAAVNAIKELANKVEELNNKVEELQRGIN